MLAPECLQPGLHWEAVLVEPALAIAEGAAPAGDTDVVVGNHHQPLRAQRAYGRPEHLPRIHPLMQLISFYVCYKEKC